MEVVQNLRVSKMYRKTSEENEAKDELQSALNRIADKSNENN